MSSASNLYTGAPPVFFVTGFTAVGNFSCCFPGTEEASFIKLAVDKRPPDLNFPETLGLVNCNGVCVEKIFDADVLLDEDESRVGLVSCEEFKEKRREFLVALTVGEDDDR